MRRPLDVLADVRARGGQLYRRRMPAWVTFAATVALLVALLAVYQALGIDLYDRESREYAKFVIAVPGFVVLGLAYLVRQIWADLPTEPYDFPMVLPLGGWGVVEAKPGEGIVLARRLSIVCLFVRPAADDLERVLDAIDPDNAFVADHDPDGFRIGIESREPRAFGFVRRFAGTDGCALVLADSEELARALDERLGFARFRTAREPPQKWRRWIAD